MTPKNKQVPIYQPFDKNNCTFTELVYQLDQYKANDIHKEIVKTDYNNMDTFNLMIKLDTSGLFIFQNMICTKVTDHFIVNKNNQKALLVAGFNDTLLCHCFEKSS